MTHTMAHTMNHTMTHTMTHTTYVDRRKCILYKVALYVMEIMLTCASSMPYTLPKDLLPGLNTSADGVTEWFDYIKKQKLRTYFNDHPFPVADQTTPEESNFRYKGLSEWIGRGLSYWWFDHNWAFTVRATHC